MVGSSLQDGQEVVVVEAAHGAARQQLDVRAGLQFGDGLLDPGASALDTKCARFGEQAAAEFRLFVRHEGTGAGTGRLQCGREPRRTGADHQHIAMPVDLVVGIGVFALGGPAKSRRMA